MIKKIFIGAVIIFIIAVISGNSKNQKASPKNDHTDLKKSTSTQEKEDKQKLSGVQKGFTALFTTGDFFANAVWNDPSIIHVGDKFIMFTSAGKGYGGDIDIYRLTSDDGVIWELSPKQAVLENGTDSNALDSKAVETPSAIYFKGVYHLFYTGYQGDFSESKKYKILHATSADGIRWTKDSSFVIAPTNPTDNVPNMNFNQWVTAEPGAVVYKDVVYLYFAAIGANKETQSALSTIGLVTSSDGKTWSRPQQVLVPDQSKYPSSKYYGYSTPAAAVRGDKLELYFDIVNREPWEQVAITKAESSDGKSGWVLDSEPMITTKNIDFGSKEVLSPSVVYVNGERNFWFAGLSGSKVTIGILK